MDKRSFILGMITAFCECVAGGCKRLALSPPLTQSDFANIKEEAYALIEKHGLLHYHEENLDLPDKERFEWIIMAAKQSTLDEYERLRAAGNSPARSLKPFFDMLSYDPQEAVFTGHDAYKEYFGRKESSPKTEEKPSDDSLITRVTKDDIPDLAPLVAQFRVTLQAFKDITAEPDVEAGAIEIQEYLDKGYPIFAARKGNVSCGYIVCRIDEPCVWVESIYVLPAFRKKGIATALFGKAEEVAASYGDDTVYNFVHPNNEVMIKFLASQGYTVLNLIEIRKPYTGETITKKIPIANQEFDY